MESVERHDTMSRLDLPAIDWTLFPQPPVRDLARQFGSDAVAAAQDLLARYTYVEPQLTRDVLAGIGSDGEAFGLDHRLKSPESLARKLDLTVRSRPIPGRRAAQIGRAAERLDDVARYTMIGDERRLPEGIVGLVARLNARDWRVCGADNLFVDGNRYKGFHLGLRHASGPRMEVQVHTPRSIRAKAVTEPLYKRVRRETGEPYAECLAAYCSSVQISSRVDNPPGLDDVDQIGNENTPVRRRQQGPPERRAHLNDTLPVFRSGPRLGSASVIVRPVDRRVVGRSQEMDR